MPCSIGLLPSTREGNSTRGAVLYDCQFLTRLLKFLNNTCIADPVLIMSTATGTKEVHSTLTRPKPQCIPF